MENPEEAKEKNPCTFELEILEKLVVKYETITGSFLEDCINVWNTGRKLMW